MKSIQVALIVCALLITLTVADPCPAGWRGIAPNCVSLASLIQGRGPCAAAISDDFMTVTMSCPMLGDPTDPQYNIGLSLFASKPSNPSTTLELSPISTYLVADGATPYAVVNMTMSLATFRLACDYASPSDSVDVYRTMISLKLLQTNGNDVDVLHTVRYRLMLTINRLVKSSTGVYVALTVDGEDVEAIAKSLVGTAAWCSSTPIPAVCSFKSNVFQAGDIATMQFSLLSSTLPLFIQNGRCVNFLGEQVWSIASGWTRYANGAGVASVSFAIPSITTCTQFIWTATVPALTASGGFEMQTITTNVIAPSVVDPSRLSWFSMPISSGGFRIQAESPTTNANLTFIFDESESTSGDSTSDSHPNTAIHLVITAFCALAYGTVMKLIS